MKQTFEAYLVKVLILALCLPMFLTIPMKSHAEEAASAPLTVSGPITVSGSTIGAGYEASLNYKNPANPGEAIMLYPQKSLVYNTDLYETFNDMDHPFAFQVVNGSYKIKGSTSADTRLNGTYYDFLESFQLIIGSDETAKELEVSVDLGYWCYYLKNKSTGQILRVTGDKNETLTATISLTDTIVKRIPGEEIGASVEAVVEADGISIKPGDSYPLKTVSRHKFDESKYISYSKVDSVNFPYTLQYSSFTLEGNNSPDTKLSNGEICVSSTETAKEIYLTEKIYGWSYYLQDINTKEIIQVYGNEGIPATGTIKIGEETSPVPSHPSKPDTIVTNTTTVTSTPSNNASETATNEVTLANGQKLTSTVGGVYNAKQVAGVAVTSPLENVTQAVNKGDGNVRFYVCDAYNKTAVNALKQAVVANSHVMLAAINIDLYHITNKGTVQRINTTENSIQLVIGLPKFYTNSGKTYSIGLLDTNGEFHVLEDKDTDPNTLTIETEHLGLMCIME